MCIRVARVFFTRNACSLRSSRARRRRFQVVSVANDRVQRLVDAIEQWRLSDAFPMKVQIPFLMSLYAQVLCSDYAPLEPADPSANWFDQPPGSDEPMPHDQSLDQAAPSEAAAAAAAALPTTAGPWTAYTELSFARMMGDAPSY